MASSMDWPAIISATYFFLLTAVTAGRLSASQPVRDFLRAHDKDATLKTILEAVMPYLSVLVNGTTACLPDME